MPTTKTCTKCGTVKPLTEFYKHRATGVLHSMLSICKSCYDAGQTAHYHANKPKSKTQPSTDHLPAWTPLKASDLPQPVLRPGALDHTKERLIRLAQLDGWGRLYHAGRVADSRQQHGQEAV